MEELDIQVSVKWVINISRSREGFIWDAIFGGWEWTAVPEAKRFSTFQSGKGCARTQNGALNKAKKYIGKEESSFNVFLDPPTNYNT